MLKYILLVILLRIKLFTCSLILQVMYSDFFVNITLFILGIIDKTEPEFKEYNKKHLNKFYNGVDRGLITFNHPSVFDIFAYNTIFKIGKTKAVAYGPYFFWPLRILSDYFNPIYTQLNPTGKSNEIQEYILSRKKGEPMLIIAPGLSDRNTDQRKMSIFKNGAFISRVPILPVVVRYSINVERWPIGKSLLKRFLSFNMVYFKIRVLDPVYPIKDESLEDFKQRVKLYMESVPLYEDLHF